MAGDEEIVNMREPAYTFASIYEIDVRDKHGQKVSMSKYRDKVLLIVNVATKSACASSMYKELNELHVKYVDEVVIRQG
ncbi:probable glutathione peroxidase 8 isoform X2 [Selaginella moellendorffii]|uniref:probable glutathione peroxidase 8 isoform X2 n=1 Tax=Selaginella moellendorffii TaxID=88036 RepID=UPI000D1C6849|nr:probable glutathione peroxidase 8 isoform X2 [Selaginella moellendorffii]|eukprot:XP_024533066.1 probable glutathione peroxidase 8 isoform X2 [Selaginella moellendorffii]